MKCRSHIILISRAADRLAGEERSTSTKCVYVCVTAVLKKKKTAENSREKQKQQLIEIYVKTSTNICGLPVCEPVFGEDPETLSEHSILAVSHGYTLVVSDWMATEKDGPATANTPARISFIQKNI